MLDKIKEELEKIKKLQFGMPKENVIITSKVWVSYSGYIYPGLIMETQNDYCLCYIFFDGIWLKKYVVYSSLLPRESNISYLIYSHRIKNRNKVYYDGD